MSRVTIYTGKPNKKTGIVAHIIRLLVQKQKNYEIQSGIPVITVSTIRNNTTNEKRTLNFFRKVILPIYVYLEICVLLNIWKWPLNGQHIFFLYSLSIFTIIVLYRNQIQLDNQAGSSYRQ